MSGRLVRILGLAALCVCVGLSLRGSMRSAERAGWLEVQLRQAAASAHEAAGASAAAQQELAQRAAAAEQRQQQLERELDGALSWSQALGEALTREAEARERTAVERAAAAALTALPPPQGVQQCLRAVRECLQADGFAGMQLLQARALEQGALRDVEFLDLAGGQGQGEWIVASELTASLDRAARRLTLRFVGGHRLASGLRSELPEAGLELELSPVDGRLWERRLPYFVTATGSHDEGAAAPAAPDTSLDFNARSQWQERIESLLSLAGGDLRLRLTGFRTMDGAEFLDARLTGYDQGRLLAFSADCARLCVELDETAGLVSLRLQDGVLRRRGSESSIHPDGYRMLLEDVTPQQAMVAMMGLVERR
jgi:hypothetical protein